MVFVLSSCGDKMYEVSFNTNGGTEFPIENVLEGQTVDQPDDPERAGYVFNYWYTSSQATAYDFDTPITEDLTINALWVADADLAEVTFDSDGGSAVDTMKTIPGLTISEPAEPTKDDFVFVHWYLDDEDTAFDFSTTIDDSIVLTAYWTDVTFEITFDSDEGSLVDSQVVAINTSADVPEEPTREDYIFGYWYLDDEDIAFDFSTSITSDLTLTAHWISNSELTAMLNEDIADIEANLLSTPYDLNIPSEGRINGSRILWYSSSDNVSKSGVVLPIDSADENTTASVTIIYRIEDLSITKTYDVDLPVQSEVVIAEMRTLNFYNTTTEYTIEEGTLDIFYEADGAVPYVKVSDFFALLEGFIDPELMPSSSTVDGVLTLEYQYYDEDEDYTYDLICIIDTNDNTITTNDPGFYWAYVYSTETNYGRHIVYDNDNPNAYYTESSDVFYDLNNYNLDMAVYEGDVVLPYYLVNQLFAGSSYYNVYYNYDALYGIYALPSSDEDAYIDMKTSSANGENIPNDLLVHTYNMFAFDLDYFYGLKDMMGISTYYDVISEHLDDLLNPSALRVDSAITDVLIVDIDEPHTSYGYPSYFNTLSYEGPSSLSSLSSYGDRFKTWYNGMSAVDGVIEAKWGREGIASNAWAANSLSRPYYWFLDDENTSAVLALDDFNTSDIEESTSFDMSIVNNFLEVEDASSDMPAISGGNKYFFYNSSTEENRFLELLVKGLDSSVVNSVIADLLTLGYTENEINQYTSYFTNDGYTVQVAFDDTYNLFYIGIMDKLSDDGELVFEASVIDTVIADSAVYMEIMLEKLSSEAPDLENIVLDVSWNTGGNVGALYRVVGFITDQAFAVSRINGDTNNESTSFVMIQGVPSYSDLNWSLLTSSVTFSAANSLSTIFKENDLGLIIGQKSGGGAASITPILLPNGTAFTMSSNSMNGYRTGSGTEQDPYVYVNNEFGIDPDVVIPVADLYNEDLLLANISG